MIDSMYRQVPKVSAESNIIWHNMSRQFPLSIYCLFTGQWADHFTFLIRNMKHDLYVSNQKNINHKSYAADINNSVLLPWQSVLILLNDTLVWFKMYMKVMRISKAIIAQWLSFHKLKWNNLLPLHCINSSSTLSLYVQCKSMSWPY